MFAAARYGAAADDMTDSTLRLRRVIDICAAAGSRPDWLPDLSFPPKPSAKEDIGI